MLSNVNLGNTAKTIVSRKVSDFSKNSADLIKDTPKIIYAKKFAKEMEAIMSKPASARTLEEKIKLTSYKTAQGLMDMKNYPPVMY